MALLLTFAALFLLLVSSEWYWHRHRHHGELSRKFLHISIACFAAFWPYFLSKNQIILLSAAFVLVVVAAKRLPFFQHYYNVQRPSWGEIWHGVAMGLLVFVLPHEHIYTAAMLELGLADGLAAVVGTRFGRGNRYHVFGAEKSLAGSAAFLVVSCLILLGYGLNGWLIVPVSIGALVLENAAPYGLDNLLVPLFIASSLLIAL